MNIKLTILAILMSACVPIAAIADPKPANAARSDPNTLAQTYAGKTQLWKRTCKGGIYYGPNWQAVAYCGKNKDSVGIGTWKVDAKGRVCHQLTWYWPSGQARGSKVDDTECISHLTDQDGKTWRSWPDSNDWWGLNGSKNLVKGSKFKSQIRRNKRKLGL